MMRHAPATARNSDPIAEVLAQELPSSGTVLEIASGSGEHAIFFANRFLNLKWQPSDLDAEALDSIRAWSAQSALENLLPPLALDASADWSAISADVILCCNMVHISPWSATEGLFAGASNILSGGAKLILYGPYLENDVETAASNLAFDQSLKARDPSWGIRALDDIDDLAHRNGFQRAARHAMPANNLTLVFTRD